MLSIKSPTVKRIAVFQLVCYLLSGGITFSLDRNFGIEVLYSGILFLINLFVWISLINKIIVLLTMDSKNRIRDSHDDLTEDENENRSGGVSLVVLFIFLFKMGLLSVICIFAMQVVSGISIIFSNTIIVLSLLFSSIRVNLSTQTGKPS